MKRTKVSRIRILLLGGLVLSFLCCFWPSAGRRTVEVRHDGAQLLAVMAGYEGWCRDDDTCALDSKLDRRDVGLNFREEEEDWNAEEAADDNLEDGTPLSAIAQVQDTRHNR